MAFREGRDAGVEILAVTSLSLGFRLIQEGVQLHTLKGESPVSIHSRGAAHISRAASPAAQSNSQPLSQTCGPLERLPSLASLRESADSISQALIIHNSYLFSQRKAECKLKTISTLLTHRGPARVSPLPADMTDICERRTQRSRVFDRQPSFPHQADSVLADL